MNQPTAAVTALRSAPPPSAPPTWVPPVVPADSIRIGSGRTLRFVGREHGSGVSFFFVDSEPGQGPDLHRHPYPETWTVIEGEVRITIDGEEFTAGAGDAATAPAGAWHRFVAIGESRLRMVCIHASDVIEQEFAE